MVLHKIINDDPFGMFIMKVLLDPTSDRSIIQVQDATNLAISHYFNLPATRENCETLKGYMNHYLALCNNCKDSEVKEDLKSQLTNIIDTLQTGIDREQSYTKNSSGKEGRTLTQMLTQAESRWKLWHWWDRKINTDPNTIEGYIRAIPGLMDMNIYEFRDKYIPAMYWKFFPPKEDFADDEAEFRYFDTVCAKIIHWYAFVKLTLAHTTPTYQVIENQYEDAEELYEYVQELGMEEPVASEGVVIETEQNQVAI